MGVRQSVRAAARPREMFFTFMALVIRSTSLVVLGKGILVDVVVPDLVLFEFAKKRV